MREEDFSLDPTGNWTDFDQDDDGDATWDLDQARAHNHVNEIDTDEVHGDADNPITETTGTAWAEPVYDAAGNTTTVPKPTSLANGYTCKYDAWNRLVEVTDGGTVAASHEYDGLNRRTIEAPVYGATTYYLHKFWNSSWQMVEMRSTTTQNAQPEQCGVSFQYVWSARYIDAPVLRDYSGTRYYFLGDANFNVTTLVDINGDAREHYHYDPYGKLTVLNGGSPDGDGAEWTADPNNTTDVDNHQLYTGRWQDYRTQFYHYRLRPYSVELGRFLSRDPMAYEGGDENLYRYAGNVPTSFADPFGNAVYPPLATHGRSNCRMVAGYFHTYDTAGEVLTRHLQRHGDELKASGREVIISKEPRGGGRNCYCLVECDALTEWDSFWMAQDYMLVAPLGVVGKTGGVVKGSWRWLKGLLFRGGRKAPIDPNKLHHIFDFGKHNLGQLLSKFGGSQDRAFRAILKAVEAVVRQRGITGTFEVVVTVAGEQITVRGTVVNGVVRIGTVFR